MKELREASPQALHHYTRFDQVNALVGASEADPDRGFMARTMALCSLPRTNPGNRHQHKRANGPFKLVMVAGADNKLPYGNLPRLLLAWLGTEAVRTKGRVLVLGPSLAKFMKPLGVHNSGGQPHFWDRTLATCVLWTAIQNCGISQGTSHRHAANSAHNPRSPIRSTASLPLHSTASDFQTQD